MLAIRLPLEQSALVAVYPLFLETDLMFLTTIVLQLVLYDASDEIVLIWFQDPNDESSQP